MDNEMNIDNRVFMNALAGVALMLFSVFVNFVGSGIPAVALTTITGISGIVLLLAAVKKDKRTLAYSL